MLSEGYRRALVARSEVDEVRDAIWDCESGKCPGPDGFNFWFVKKFWDILKPEILRMLDEFHMNGVLPRGCNSYFLTLIPKKLISLV